MKSRVLPGLFEIPSRVEMPRFDGPAYVPALDQQRLTGQLLTIYTLMRDGQWRTLHEIAAATGAPESSVSAQLRHLRKKRFGAYDVQRRRVSASGLHEYRLEIA